MATFEPQFIVRLAEPEDIAILIPLIQALATEEGAEAPDSDDLAAILTAMLTTGFSDFVIAETGFENGEPLGCIQINYRLSTWNAAAYAYIEDFYLLPEARGRGIGTKLLDYACQRAEGRGCINVQLDVRETNKAAHRLYARYGFKASSSTIWKRSIDSACESDGAEEISEIVDELRHTDAESM